MADIAWIGIEETAAGARGWGFDVGNTLRAEAQADDGASVAARLPEVPALVVSDRAAPGARAVPTRVLPESGPLTPLSQATPPALLPASACLRLAGALASRPHWDGVCVLPLANVTHWVHVSAGEVVSLAGFLTPGLAQMLGAGVSRPGVAAVNDTMARPERLAAHLAQADVSNDGAATLGHLIGAEMAAARPYWLGQAIVVIGEGELPVTYARALADQGARPDRLSAANAAQAGLCALHGR